MGVSAVIALMPLVVLLCLSTAEKVWRSYQGTAVWHPMLLRNGIRQRALANTLMLSSAMADTIAIYLIVFHTTLGVLLSLILLSLYTGTAFRAERTTEAPQSPPGCRCFGRVFETPVGPPLFTRNVLLAFGPTLILLLPFMSSDTQDTQQQLSFTLELLLGVVHLGLLYTLTQLHISIRRDTARASPISRA